MTVTHKTSGQRIVLAYSGGIDASLAVPWLAATHGAEVIAVTLDLGQKKEWLEELRDRALASGAVRAHVVDVRDEFARDYLLRALKVGLLGPDSTSMTSALAGPLVAQTLVSIAGIEQAGIVAHGDPLGDQAPLVRAIAALAPAMTPLTVPASMAIAADGAEAPRTATPGPSEPAYLEIALQRGVPTGVNGVAMPWADLVGSLDIIARAHDGAPPPLVLLDVAHRALHDATIPADAERFGAQVGAEYLRMLHEGTWFSPMRAALDAYVDKIEERVGGVVRLELTDGACRVVEAQVAAAPTIIPMAKA